MKDPLGVIPSEGNQGTTRGKEKIPLTSVEIEPTTSGLDVSLLIARITSARMTIDFKMDLVKLLIIMIKRNQMQLSYRGSCMGL